MDCMEKIMQQVVINIKDDSKLELFLKFIKHLDFVEINKKKRARKKLTILCLIIYLGFGKTVI